MPPLRKIFLAALLTLAATSQALSASGLTTAERADSAYNATDYPLAIELYNTAITNDGVSADIYYNLGNAYYRNSDIAHAILNYERALKLDSTHADARYNLELCNAQIIDDTSTDTSYSTSIFTNATHLMTANGWAVAAIVLFVIVLSLAGGYIFLDSVKWRKVCFFAGIAFILIDIASIVIAINVKNRITSTDEAIVTAQATQLSTSPATPVNNDQQAFMLHEGCKVTILDSVATPLDPLSPLWYEVQADENHRAWIKSTDLEKI